MRRRGFRPDKHHRHSWYQATVSKGLHDTARMTNVRESGEGIHTIIQL